MVSFRENHCTVDDGELQELCIGENANRNQGMIGGQIPMRRTKYFDDTEDWAILERIDVMEFGLHLPLCNISNLPYVDDRVRTCFAPCDLIIRSECSVLQIKMGDFCRITQYSPESTKALHNDFEASKSVSVESEREDPLNIYLSVDGGMFGGCCGAPYIDTENRVVAFHLYSGDDSIPVKVAVIKEATKTKKIKKTPKKQDIEDVASSNGGYASVKQGLIISKLEKLVCAVRELLGIDLNSDVAINAVVFDP